MLVVPWLGTCKCVHGLVLSARLGHPSLGCMQRVRLFLCIFILCIYCSKLLRCHGMAMTPGPSSVLGVVALAFAGQLGLIQVFKPYRVTLASTTTTTTSFACEALTCPPVEACECQPSVEGYAAWQLWAAGYLGALAGIGLVTSAYLLVGGIAGLAAGLAGSFAFRGGRQRREVPRALDWDLDLSNDDGRSRKAEQFGVGSGRSPASDVSW